RLRSQRRPGELEIPALGRENDVTGSVQVGGRGLYQRLERPVPGHASTAMTKPHLAFIATEQVSQPRLIQGNFDDSRSVPARPQDEENGATVCREGRDQCSLLTNSRRQAHQVVPVKRVTAA